MANVAIRSAPAAPLEERLRAEVRGRVRFDEAARGAYARDASHFRQVPVGVVEPETFDDVEAALAACREHGVPVLARGGGTSLAGQCCNEAVVVDCSRHLDAIEDVDLERGVARVQPGVVLDDLQRLVAPHDLWFGPDPSTHGQCTFGGMVANNACGVHSVATGRTVDNVERLEVLTARGERFWVGPGTEGGHEEITAALAGLGARHEQEIRDRFPDIPRRVSGYNLDELLGDGGPDLARALVGTEGTCALVLRAEVRLRPKPPARALAVLGYADIVEAARRAPEVLEWEPVGLEGIDAALTGGVAAAGALPDAGGYLFAEIPGETLAEAGERARGMVAGLDGLAAEGLVVTAPGDVRRLWSIRESGIRATTRVHEGREVWPGWEDSAVAPERFGDYLDDLRALMGRHGYHGGMYGHFGDGCLHVRIDFDLASGEGRRRYRTFVEEAADLVVAHGGALSGEHGDGQARGELLERMYGAELVDAFREFRRIWDPDGLLNPGKVVDARPLDADHAAATPLRRDRDAASYFAYGDDGGSFAAAAGRCIGIGKCRDASSGTMCPSYMATRDEIHSTRGRARLLQEMLRGEVVDDGWRSDAVDEALDLCLACKGCVDECPVSVDMATYKAEFLAQRYRRRIRPLRHYLLGLSPTWARLASATPRLANRLGRSRMARPLKRMAGIEPDRPTPLLAEETFRAWWRRRPVRPVGEREVVLFPDTFTDHFEPRVGRAAVAVLEDAGFAVRVPEERVCCGLPNITTGMLGRARRRLAATVRALDGTGSGPIVGLEPSCAAVFRHELPALLPGDAAAGRVAERVRTLAELLATVEGWSPRRDVRGGTGGPGGPGGARSDGGDGSTGSSGSSGSSGSAQRALVQFHCHHGAVLGTEADRELLERTGLEAEVPDTGCCGLAGSFGFELGHGEVSMQVGERRLFPAIRAEGEDTLLVADGFSCRRQIEAGTGRSALHLAEVLDPRR